MKGEFIFLLNRQTYQMHSHDIETVKKERVFDSEITEEEMDIIAKRVALQQKAVCNSNDCN